jgi:glycosyltransferase involved in cell wall biosynthesis
MLLSVIVPCFNEEGNIDLFYDETVKALGDLMPETELIFVNDGSRDGTVEKLRALCARAQYRVRVVSFSRNFGKEAALLAGLEHATGDFTSIIDADLQQNPSYIVEMMQILKDHPEYDAVAAYQEERRENFLISFIKKTFYKVMDSLTDVKIMQAASDFRLLRRPVVDAILSMPEKCRFSKGIFAWVGFETYYMPYEVEERASGTSKWNFWKLLTYAFDGIVAFSNKPLIMSSVVGFFIFCLSILYLIVIVVKTILWGDPVAGFPTLACLILMLSGIQLLGIGILGQYMAKNYTETKGRPVYIVKEEMDSAGGAHGAGEDMRKQDL